jgi:hypothetical protein
MVASGGCQKTSFEEKPFQYWNWIRLSKQTQFGCDTDALSGCLVRDNGGRMVMRTFTNARQVANHLNVMFLQVFLRPNSTAHQYLWGCYSSTRHKYFTACFQRGMKGLVPGTSDDSERASIRLLSKKKRLTIRVKNKHKLRSHLGCIVAH